MGKATPRIEDLLEKTELADAIWNGYYTGQFDEETKRKLVEMGQSDDIDKYDYIGLSNLYDRFSYGIVTFLNETYYPVGEEDDSIIINAGYPTKLQNYFRAKFGDDVMIETREFNTMVLVYSDPYYRIPSTFGKFDDYSGQLL